VSPKQAEPYRPPAVMVLGYPEKASGPAGFTLPVGTALQLDDGPGLAGEYSRAAEPECTQRHSGSGC
jgi:hypothetical protein